jgi:hypothetical protein
LKEQAQTGNSSHLSFMSSRPLGEVWVLHHFWCELSIQSILKKLLKSRNFQIPVKRAIFTMVANRDPSSKLAVEDWVREDVFIPDLT